MEILFQAIFSFLCLAVASWCVGEGGEILGKKYDASIIGGLVIAWLNTAPEAIFFVTALSSGNTRFAVGAVSGSTIVVCTVALGCCLWIGTGNRPTKYVQLQPPVKKQCLILMMSLVIPSILTLIGFNLFFGLVGVLFYLGFVGYSLFHKLPETPGKDDDEHMELGTVEKKDGASAVIDMPKEHEEEEEADEPLHKGVLYLFVGGAMICYFSSPFINSIVSLASQWEVNPILLAFFLAPVASEMPEILESISLSRKGHSQSINIAFSNLIGGTITKTTLLMGIFCFYGVYKNYIWESPTYSLSLGLLTVCSLVSASIGYYVQKLQQKHGLLLFLVFILTGSIQYYYNINADIEPTETM